MNLNLRNFVFLLLLMQGSIMNAQSNKMNSKMYENALTPGPVATAVPHTLEAHGDVRQDPYYWLKEREDPNVSAYLNQENAYREQVMGHLTAFESHLYAEMIGRIKQADESVPYTKNGYSYITRFDEGQEYPIYARQKVQAEGETILLNVNELAKPFSYFNVGGLSVSPDNKILAYGEDTLSRRIYTIRFKDIDKDLYYDDVIPNTTGGTVWANDNKTVFYSVKDETLRSYKIFKHKLGSPASEDVEVYHEKDATFNTFVYKTKSEQYIIIGSSQTVSNEYRLLNADDPDGEFVLFNPRERDLEYTIDHFENYFYIRTNLEAKNFRLMRTPVDKTQPEYWEEVIAHREDVLLEGMEIFKDYLVLSERKNAITQIRIKPWKGEEHYINFGEEVYMAYTSVNPEYDTPLLRMGYTSMTTPNSVYDYDMKARKLDLKKQTPVLGGFDAKNYITERVYATATDGVQIPISLVYHKDLVKKDGTAPLLLYGYGSYGYSMDPYFSSVRLSLLDRGFVYAIAHIRGGEELGRQWYENGKLLNKKNTFTDFIACGEHLVAKNYGAKDQLYAMGGSAGGLLMGAVINMRPDMWKGVIAAVPFVDVITTMMDETIPLTTGEYDEWGNPNDPTYYNYIKSYSPYDNIEAKDYPTLLITTGFHDSQVQYWEPAKWIARLRALKTDKNPLLMYCNMTTGHGGASGRFEALRESAMEYAFLLDLAGKAK